jgi:hypothetical protein
MPVLALPGVTSCLILSIATELARQTDGRKEKKMALQFVENAALQERKGHGKVLRGGGGGGDIRRGGSPIARCAGRVLSSVRF